jgi:hypothetical protein
MKHRKPQWWQLYSLVPLMFGLMALEHWAPLPGISDTAVDAGIVVLTFVAMLVWVHLNGGLLEWYYVERGEASSDLKITVYEPASKRQANVKISDDSTHASRTNGNGKSTSGPNAMALPQHPAREFKPRYSRRKGKNRWHRN